MTTLLLVLAALYLLTQSRQVSVGPVPAPIARPPATGQFSASGATRIVVPGVGQYINIPGGGVSITLDPALYGVLFPSVTVPMIAQPVPAPDFQAFDVVTAPVDVFPGTGSAVQVA